MDISLTRFIEAQEAIYDSALAELRAGHKRSHWMWFIFPQLAGLGRSSTARYYALEGLDEARAYLAHPLLGPRLDECTAATLGHTQRSALDIFGPLDELKFRSSLTLFALVTDPGSTFQQALQRFFGGRQDQRTLELLGRG